MADATSRRAFVGTGARGLRGSALAAAAPEETVTEGAFDARFDGDTFLLQLDGKNTGWVFEPQGGEVSGDIAIEKIAPLDFVAKKHIANVKYNEFTLKAGVGMSKGLYEWVKNSWDRDYTRKSGEVIAADFDYKPKAAARFTDALITEVTIPALDGGAKEPAYFTIKMRPTLTAYEPPGNPDTGGIATKPAEVAFQLNIDGLDTSSVAKIDSFTVKQGFAAAADGSLEPSNLEIPNLSVWVDPVGAESWTAWEDDFVLKGNSGDDKERSGSLVYFNPKEVLRLSFSHLGIFKGTPEASENNGDKIRRVKYELYCENITMKLGESGWA